MKNQIIKQFYVEQNILLIIIGMKNILTSGLIPSIVENICGYKVNLYKEKINYKYSNTGFYKPHQDITAYPDSKNHITCMINLCIDTIIKWVY